ncbi:chemotaxis protein CheA [Pseudoroseicyclus sp. CXY001]|uniref:chemotaxis protein CheA n=1 Tax=Pseudoroseicyclus sp. CXY001 TaxID=3242492 RepID=UPI003570F471
MQASIRDTFFEECEELLEAMVEGLGVIDEGQYDSETVNAVFRAVHSIKGGAGAFGLTDLVSFAHTFETVFDEVRSERLPVTPELVAVLFRAGDQLATLVEAARDETGIDEVPRDAVLKELKSYLDEPEEVHGGAEAGPPGGFQPMTLDFSALALPMAGGADGPLAGGESFAAPELPAAPAEHLFDIRFQPDRALIANGHEPMLLIRALSELGTLAVTAQSEELPAFDELDPEECYLKWSMTLRSESDRAAVEKIFEFVEGLCSLDISEIGGDTPAAAPAAPAAPTPSALPSAAASAPRPAAPAAPQAPPAAAPAAAPPPRPRAAADEDAKAKAGAHQARATLRVELDRVDRLINTVGELIINQAMLSQRIAELELPKGADAEVELEDYKLLAREIQEGVMAIRAQPVKPLFQRMARIVREACTATGKRARLVTVGDHTEVDKTVIERLSDPLTHMIRNSIDHGLEKPEKRRDVGKDPEGEVRLSASQRSGSIFIEIADDGAGLNRPKILEIAMSKGLVPQNAELSDAEIDNLIFAAGFSTATEVSNLSGRGVGMDVVRTSIQQLGGRVSIASETGKGTTLTIILPLTLAVMDGMVVSVRGQTMVVPIASVLETIRPKEGDVHRIGSDEEVLSIRGSYVPIIDVAASLGMHGQGKSLSSSVLILVETEQRGQCALALDAIHDQRQVVIKSLDRSFGDIPGVSAATILGDGKIALIIDPDGVAQIAGRRSEAGPSSAPVMEFFDE